MKLKSMAVASAVAAMAAMVGLAGCAGGQDEEVATLESGQAPTPTEDAIADQARGARDLLACLEQIGVPAEIDDPLGDGQLYVNLMIEDDYLVSWGEYTNGVPAGISESMLEMAAKYDPPLLEQFGPNAPPSPSEDPDPSAVPAYLIWGTEDRTQEWRGCLDSSGYTEPVNYPDPEAEVATKEANIKATLPWIACARQNGYPEMKDPLPVKADDWETEPMALLPADISEQQLADLIAACPVVDLEVKAQREAALAELGPDAPPDQVAAVWEEFPVEGPIIGIDLPGLDGDMRPGRPTDAPVDERIPKLFNMIREASGLDPV
ncbi:MAG: hypothetical protein LBO20_01415, partial [Bifidobacteriaceae bacterium]|nr:hypothetical protein [Bifidobacteriaceae bacterium]